MSISVNGYGKIEMSRAPFQWLMRCWAISSLVLFGLTWRLWVGQPAFPQIPFFETFVEIPALVDRCLFPVLLICPFGVLIAKAVKTQRRFALGFAICCVMLVLLDQNRLQPWVYHFLIIASLFFCLSKKAASRALRWVVISIYVYSAVSKFDYQFVQSVGAQMLTAISDSCGIVIENNGTRRWLVLGFPLGELLVGGLLTFRKSRLLGVIAAVALHLGLVLILGPFGLNHQWPVLIWNLFFVVQAVILFWIVNDKSEADVLLPEDEVEPQLQDQPANRPVPDTPTPCPFPRLGWAITAFAILFPLTQPIGICDHWPAWEVYAPRTSRAELKSGIGSERSIGQLSLDSYGVPIYPQARVQFAIARAIAQKGKLPCEIRVYSESDRWTGERAVKQLTGDQIEMHADHYRLNIRPRWFPAVR